MQNPNETFSRLRPVGVAIELGRCQPNSLRGILKFRVYNAPSLTQANGFDQPDYNSSRAPKQFSARETHALNSVRR
jgi:hypothetical protein